jgi:uncharacterized repeat protein (TIGR01451 family)
MPDASVASGESEAEIPEIAANETPSEEAATDISAQNATIEEPANETVPQEDINVTTEGNATTADNETEEEPVIVPEVNETLPEENVTVSDENATIPEINATIPGIAAIEVFIENPQKITRGQEFTARAVIRNSGDGPAENATLEWILPEGFSIVSGNTVENIGTIAAGEERAYEIIVRTSVATARGANEIKARVTYE